MKIKLHKSRVSDALDKDNGPVTLKSLDSIHIVSLLEQNIELRETPISERIKKKLVMDKSKNLNTE